MLKKEINEVKKSLSLKNCSINQIWESIYDFEGKKEFSNSFSFNSLDDNKKTAYIDIFKKTLSSNLHKNSYNVKLENSLIDDNVNGLYHLYRTEIDDDVFKFMDDLSKLYYNDMGYSIILCKCAYDIPVEDDEDKILDSDEVYNFLVLSICPFKDNKPNLVEDSSNKTLMLSNNSWVLSNPEVGFLYPSFNSRGTDINEALYYAKNREKINEELVEFLFGFNSFNEKKYSQDFYNEILESNVKDITLNKFSDINESIRSFAEEMEESGSEPVLSNSDVKRYISEDFSSDEDVTINVFGVSSDKYTITLSDSNDIKLNLTKDGLNMVQEKDIDGVSYILIPTTGLKVNGVRLGQGENGD